MAAKRKQPQPVDLEAILPVLCDHLKMRGAIKWTELTRLGVPRSQHPTAIERLRDAGFEVTPKLIRMPIEQQIRTALAERGQVPVKGMQNVLSGCSAKELVQAIDNLVHSGIAIRVLRTKAEWLAPSDSDVLSTDELLALNRSVTEWAKQTQRVKTSSIRRLTIWRDDVLGLLELLGGLARSNRGPSTGIADISKRLRRIVQEQVNPSVGLAFVPTVVQELQLPIEQAHNLLIEQARSGHLELRPDGGAARFTEAELKAAPLGPDGSRLLWVRLLEVSP